MVALGGAILIWEYLCTALYKLSGTCSISSVRNVLRCQSHPRKQETYSPAFTDLRLSTATIPARVSWGRDLIFRSTAYNPPLLQRHLWCCLKRVLPCTGKSAILADLQGLCIATWLQQDVSDKQPVRTTACCGTRRHSTSILPVSSSRVSVAAR